MDTSYFIHLCFKKMIRLHKVSISVTFDQDIKFMEQLPEEFMWWVRNLFDVQYSFTTLKQSGESQPRKYTI